jgi:thermitase
MWRGTRGTFRFFLFAAVFFSTNSLSSGQVLDCNADFVPGRVLVRFKATSTAAGQQAAHTAAGALLVLREYPAVAGLQLVQVLPGQEQGAIASYTNDPGVQYAEPDYIARFVSPPNDPDFAQAKTWALHNAAQSIRDCSPTCGCKVCLPGAECPSCPNEALCQSCPDEGFWDADIDAPAAWDITTGHPDFRIAVLDSGVAYDHPDFYNDLNADGNFDVGEPTNIWTDPEECPGGLLRDLRQYRRRSIPHRQ